MKRANPEGLNPVWPNDDWELDIECDISCYADALYSPEDEAEYFAGLYWNEICATLRAEHELAEKCRAIEKWILTRDRKRLNELMELDPIPESPEGQELIVLVDKLQFDAKVPK